MQVLLSDACQQQQKPTIAFVGATIQPGLSDTASSMVSTTCPHSHSSECSREVHADSNVHQGLVSLRLHELHR